MAHSQRLLAEPGVASSAALALWLYGLSPCVPLISARIPYVFNIATILNYNAS